MKKIILTVALVLNFQSALAAEAKPFSKNAFKSAISKGESFVVAFHSDSCGSCKIQKPNLESALKEAPLESVEGLMANFESTNEFRKTLAKPVRGPSTILVFKNGQEVARILGETSKEKIRNLIANAIKTN